MDFLKRKKEQSPMKFVRPVLFAFLAVLFASAILNAQQLFDSWITYSIDKAPTCVQSADMDNDGDLDLVIGHYMGRAGVHTVIVMENNGQGFFTLRHTLHPAQNSGQVRAIDVFDLDGDGDLEIMTAHDPTDKVNFFRNKGGGNGFELPIECRAGDETYDVTAGFLDGDGFPELLAVNRTEGTVSIYKNRGSAAYPAESVKVVGIEPRSIELFDMDNDGDNDIAVSVAADPFRRAQLGFNGFVLFENEGNGAIDDSARVLYKIANPNLTFLDTILNPYKILAADFNNDNFLDLAVACSSSIFSAVANKNVVCVFLNRQDGTFDANPAFSRPERYTVGYGCRSIAAADVDGDGDQDIISANQEDGTISVLKNNGNGTFAPKVDFLTPNNPPSVVSGGDYDGDGDFDVAVVSLGKPPSNPGNSFAVLKNKGDGNFEVGTEFLAGDLNVQGNIPFGIAAGNVDGDGDIDLAIANQGIHDVTIHRNDGSGSFPNPVCCADWYFPPPSPRNWFGPRAIVLADLDGDGDLDFAIANQGSNNIAVYKNNGTGGYAVDSTYSTGGGSAPFWIAAANLDGDGDIDLVTANQGVNYISVFKNNGNATFAAAVNYIVGFRPVFVFPADLDGDGDNDMVSCDQGTDDFLDSVSLLFNDGSGTFPVRTALQVGSAPTSVVAADLDGDGDGDLAVTVAGTASREDTAVVVFKNSGSGTFTFNQRLLPGAGPNHIVAADFDGDGDLDLITVDKARSAISFFANDGNGTFAAAQGFGAGIDPRFAAVGDFNGDGDLDLAVTNQRGVSVPGQGAFTVLRNQTVTPGLALRGDLNGDRVYNLVDITQQCNCIFLGTGVCTLSLSDVNCDGGLSPVDIILLLQKVFVSMSLPC